MSTQRFRIAKFRKSSKFLILRNDYWVRLWSLIQAGWMDGFNMVAGTHSEGGVCAGEDIVELEECLCWCQNEETCSAVDWKYVLESSIIFIQNPSRF